MSETIRVLIADDHALVRYGLRALLASEPGIEVVGEAADGTEAVELARTLQPGVLLLDLLMPRKDGLQVIAELAEDLSSVHILVLTSFAEDERLFPALKAGALGYLLKEATPHELLAAVRAVARGDSAVPPALMRRVLQEIARPPARPLVDPLTERELEVLGLVALGLSNQEIAERLHVHERTVRSHVSTILDKLQLSSRVQAALYALRTGIARLESE